MVLLPEPCLAPLPSVQLGCEQAPNFNTIRNVAGKSNGMRLGSATLLLKVVGILQGCMPPLAIHEVQRDFNRHSLKSGIKKIQIR